MISELSAQRVYRPSRGSVGAVTRKNRHREVASGDVCRAGLTFHPGAPIIIKIGFFWGCFLGRGLGVKLRPFSQTGLRLLWVTMLIPGLFRVPLPQADYHNIRHHHGVGEICPHHDHLLRWHPTAGQADDVAVVHWHWIIPQTGDSGDNSGSENDNPLAPARLHLHAYHLDSLEPDWTGDPVIVPDCRGRLLPDPSSVSPGVHLAHDLALIRPPSARAWPGSVPEPIAPGIVRAGLLGLSQQWNC